VVAPCEVTGPFNTRPIALPDPMYATPFGVPLDVPAPGVLGNDSDADGDALVAQLDVDAAHGALALAADGAFTYAPDPGFAGTDSFTYSVLDARGGLSDPATVTITVGDPSVVEIPTLSELATLLFALTIAGVSLLKLRS
jgi:VCBS repeat-containing protein